MSWWFLRDMVHLLPPHQWVSALNQRIHFKTVNQSIHFHSKFEWNIAWICWAVYESHLLVNGNRHARNCSDVKSLFYDVPWSWWQTMVQMLSSWKIRYDIELYQRTFPFTPQLLCVSYQCFYFVVLGWLMKLNFALISINWTLACFQVCTICIFEFLLFFCGGVLVSVKRVSKLDSLPKYVYLHWQTINSMCY